MLLSRVAVAVVVAVEKEKGEEEEEEFMSDEFIRGSLNAPTRYEIPPPLGLRDVTSTDKITGCGGNFTNDVVTWWFECIIDSSRPSRDMFSPFVDEAPHVDDVREDRLPFLGFLFAPFLMLLAICCCCCCCRRCCWSMSRRLKLPSVRFPPSGIG